MVLHVYCFVTVLPLVFRLYLWALSIRRKIWFEFLFNFPEFQGKRSISRRVPKFSEISYRVFAVHLIFLPEFPEFSIERFALEIPQFPNFSETFQGNFHTIVLQFLISAVSIYFRKNKFFFIKYLFDKKKMYY